MCFNFRCTGTTCACAWMAKVYRACAPEALWRSGRQTSQNLGLVCFWGALLCEKGHTLRKFSRASWTVALGGSPKRVAAIFLSIHVHCATCHEAKHQNINLTPNNIDNRKRPRFGLTPVCSIQLQWCPVVKESHYSVWLQGKTVKAVYGCWSNESNGM